MCNEFIDILPMPEGTVLGCGVGNHCGGIEVVWRDCGEACSQLGSWPIGGLQAQSRITKGATDQYQPSIHPSTHLSIYPSIHLFICRSVCWSIYLAFVSFLNILNQTLALFVQSLMNNSLLTQGGVSVKWMNRDACFRERVFYVTALTVWFVRIPYRGPAHHETTSAVPLGKPWSTSKLSTRAACWPLASLWWPHSHAT